MATTGSPGPVYLTATREVLAQPIESITSRPRPLPSCRLGGLSSDAVKMIGNALIDAKLPLVVTGYLGRNHLAVNNLVHLANLVKGIQVFDSEVREVSFPANHPAWITRGTGAAMAVQNADVILVLDADVPWIPTQVGPIPDAQIFHIDLDPRKERMVLFDIGATATYLADSALALYQLIGYISQSDKIHSYRDFYAERWKVLQTSFLVGQKLVTDRARAALQMPNAATTVDFLCYTLRSIAPTNTIFVSDSVSNQAIVNEQLRFTRLGSHLTKGGSGLGWAGGAAIGVKLATQLYNVIDRPALRPREPNDDAGDPFICMFTGDGSFLFSVPTAAYWASYYHKCPFLTVILNNGGWCATRQCIVDVHPHGLASKMTNEELGISLEADSPNYGEVAKAAANGNLWTTRITRVADLKAALVEGKRVVLEENISAVIDVIVQHT